jgi:hypothetical protein
MSFDLFLGQPYSTGSVVPPGGDASLSRAVADRTSGRFEATSFLDVLHPDAHNVSVLLSRATPVPGGCTRIDVTYKIAIGHFTSVFVVPGPGYVATTCGVDFFAIRTKLDGSMTTVLTSRVVLAHAWSVLIAPIGDTGTVPEVMMNTSFPIPVPGGTTQAGEVWQFTVRPWAETGGAGFFLPGATAQVTGSVYGFRVVGV